MSEQQKRIVITGMGRGNPAGYRPRRLFGRASFPARPGSGNVTRFDTTDYDVKIAAEVKGFDPSDYLDKREVRRTDRFAQFGIASALMAVNDSGLEINEQNAPRVGVLVGSGIGGLETLEAQFRVLYEKGPGRVSPLVIPDDDCRQCFGANLDFDRRERPELDGRDGVRDRRARNRRQLGNFATGRRRRDDLRRNRSRRYPDFACRIWQYESHDEQVQRLSDPRVAPV